MDHYSASLVGTTVVLLRLKCKVVQNLLLMFPIKNSVAVTKKIAAGRKVFWAIETLSCELAYF